MDCDPHLDAALLPPEAPPATSITAPNDLVERLLLKIDRASKEDPLSAVAYVDTLIRSIALETATDLVGVLPPEYRQRAGKALVEIVRLKTQRKRKAQKATQPGKAAPMAKARPPSPKTATSERIQAFQKALNKEPDLDPEWQPHSGTPRLLSAPTLISRGWTQRMIIDLLDRPDAVLPGREHLCRPKDLMFLFERVLAAEALTSFKDNQDKAAARVKAAKVRVKHQRDRLNAEMDSEPIVIPIMPLASLRRIAFEQLNLLREELRANYKPLDHRWIATAHQKRIMVNYVRHYLTSYDTCLGRCIGRIGRHGAQLRIKSRVLKEIAAAYPILADECAIQRNRIEHRFDEGLEDDLAEDVAACPEQGTPPFLAADLAETGSLEDQ